MNRIRFILVFLIFSSLSILKANDYTEIKVNELLKISFVYFSELDLSKSILYAKKSLELSRKEKYTKGIIKSNIYIAKALLETGVYETSLDYIEEAESKLEKNNYPCLKIEIYRLKSIIYANLNMNQLSINEIKKQNSLFENNQFLSDVKTHKFLYFQNLSHVYRILGNQDSVNKYLKLQNKLIIEDKLNVDEFIISRTYSEIGEYFIHIEKYDSAQLYLKKAQDVVSNYNKAFEYYSQQKYGILYSKLKDRKKAIFNFELALSNAKKINNPNAILSSYKLLSDYMINNNIELGKANFYYYKYHSLNDSLNYGNKIITDRIINNILSDEIKKRNENNILTIKVSFYIFFSFIGIFYIIYKSRQRNKVENNYIEILIDDYKFEKMIGLLKNNSPEFLILFKELYPKFVENLKKLNPNIKSKELSFCAMIFLNYSSKDIAVFTFVSLRAVQIRKNRLRKKYNISSEVDINRWMRNLNI